jgi:hypothetical protein
MIVKTKFRLNGPLPPDVDDFTKAYLEAMVWTESDDFPIKHIDKSLLTICIEFCADFQTEQAHWLNLAYQIKDYSMIHAGHDLWLTRNGHGAGYWDGDLPEIIGEALTEAAKQAGNMDVYLDDGVLS